MAGARQGLRRLRALLRKEFLLLLRDPRMRFFVVVPPLIQLVIFGYAATFDVRFAEVGVVDAADTAASRALLAAVAATGHYRLQRYAAPDDAEAAMAAGRVRAVLRLQPDFAVRPVIQLLVDGSDSNSAQVILGQLKQALKRASAPVPGPVTLVERNWFNPNLDDRWYFIPGIMANVVLIATLILTAMSVVRERELGTLERLLVTPLGRFEFVVGKLLPVAAIGLFDVLLITIIAIGWFQVPFRGSLAMLLFASSLYLLSSLGIGLLISSYAGTQQQAMLLAFFVIMPLVILSGFAFPIANMPRPVQWLTWLDPLRYYLVVVRDLFLKGSDPSAHGFELLMMLLLGAASMLLSVRRVR
ncbi:MAG TPA: ABC transporter permease [Sedimenticola thiotaurini]|uniref:Transport permease protein n=1 Tax=Sedimenticola thiotaurini TaxID=1543721 RepID=A0A831RMF2_9GAMM|nr:ABC transporter permease [Sedimenticola thiotaurini]